MARNEGHQAGQFSLATHVQVQEIVPVHVLPNFIRLTISYNTD